MMLPPSEFPRSSQIILLYLHNRNKSEDSFILLFEYIIISMNNINLKASKGEYFCLNIFHKIRRTQIILIVLQITTNGIPDGFYIKKQLVKIFRIPVTLSHTLLSSYKKQASSQHLLIIYPFKCLRQQSETESAVRWKMLGNRNQFWNGIKIIIKPEAK